MIHKLKIQNFQSHEDNKLRFDPGVNVIVGGSDTGKSSIIRALRWLVLNKPSGDSFRSYWGGETSVEIQTENAKVKRLKSKIDNLYRLDGNLFKSFGTETPEEVRTALNLDEVNLQTQFESHFLLSRSAGEVAQYFNRIAHLDKIDTGLKNIRSWEGKIKNEINADDASNARLQGQLDDYSDIEIIEEKLITLEGAEALKQEKEDELKSVSDLIDSVKEVAREIGKQSKLVRAEGQVDELLQVINQRTEYKNELNDLVELKENLKTIQKRKKEYSAIIEAEPIVTRIMSKESGKQKVQESQNELKDLIKQVTKSKELIEEKEEELKELEEGFHKNIGEVCPLCEQKIK